VHKTTVLPDIVHNVWPLC